MTVGQALERAEELRPGSRIALATRQAWLKEADAMLRERFFKNSITDAYDDVGADLAWDDSLQDDDVLLAPAPFDALYPHYLCAMTDAALGETDRYVGEQAQYNSLLADLAAWLRRSSSVFTSVPLCASAMITSLIVERCGCADSQLLAPAVP